MSVDITKTAENRFGNKIKEYHLVVSKKNDEAPKVRITDGTSWIGDMSIEQFRIIVREVERLVEEVQS